MITKQSREYTKFYCGPLEVHVFSDSDTLLAKARETLGLYNVRWTQIECQIFVYFKERQPEELQLSGTYLRTRRMGVDNIPDGLIASCDTGATANYHENEGTWHLNIPAPGLRGLVDVEDLLGLVLTTGWRKLDWIPIHAGGVIYHDKCAILCAPSGGGKSTLTTALLSKGWETLGDDKLLLSIKKNGNPVISSLLLNFNLHPHVEQWFPEVGDLERLPSYSDWTPKRRVNVNLIWPENNQVQAKPTHLILLNRIPEEIGFRLHEINKREILPLLLKQTVIPQEINQAGRILEIIAKTACQLRGWKLDIGEGAYQQVHDLEILNQAIT